MSKIAWRSLPSWRTVRSLPVGWRLVFSCHLKLVSCNYSSGSAQMAQRRTYGSDPLQMRQFGGINRASRRHKMSIQRLPPSQPPDISADV